MAYPAVNNSVEFMLRKINQRLEVLEENAVVTVECVDEVFSLEEKLEDRLDTAEEEITSLKVQNMELTNHLNLVINEFNNLKNWVKEHRQPPVLFENISADDATGDVIVCTEEFNCFDISDEEEEKNPKHQKYQCFDISDEEEEEEEPKHQKYQRFDISDEEEESKAPKVPMF